MEYNNIYKNNKDVWGSKPNDLLQKIYTKVNNLGNFLDLGCGQGRDSLFMLQKGFNVTAVDKSKEGIEKIKEYIQKNNLPQNKINFYCQDIRNYNIESDKFDIINVFNSLQFLPKKEALILIDKIKNVLKNEGYVIIAGFIIAKDISREARYKKTINDNRCFFEPQELEKIFSNFNILFYEEKEILDKGHPGSLEPHKHHIVKMIAQKIKNSLKNIPSPAQKT